MAKPYKYTLKDGTVQYYVKWTTPDHVSHTQRGFKRKRDADDFLARVTVNLNDDNYIDPNAGKMPVSVLYETYKEGKKGTVKPSYYRDIESAWKVHVEPKWGNREIKTIRTSEVQTWVSQLSTGDERNDIPGKSASVVIRAYDLLKQIMDLAVADKIIRRTPCTNINLPKKVRKKRTYLTAKQVIALAKASEGHDTLILVLGFCGLRMGEARALKVGCVDMRNNRLSIQESVTRVSGEWTVNKPKTWETREVPVPAPVMKALRKTCEGRGPDDLVFPGRAGGRYLKEQQRTGYGWYHRALDAYGGPSLTMHDLRHTAASIAISSGANVKVIQRMLGHKTAAMTLDTYADLFDADLDTVAEKVGEKIDAAVRNE